MIKISNLICIIFVFQYVSLCVNVGKRMKNYKSIINEFNEKLSHKYINRLKLKIWGFLSKFSQIISDQCCIHQWCKGNTRLIHFKLFKCRSVAIIFAFFFCLYPQSKKLWIRLCFWYRIIDFLLLFFEILIKSKT